MTILYPAGVKREWFDRNPNITNLSYFNVNGPHTETVRITYTVGGSRLAFVQAVGFYINRQTAAGAIGEVKVRLNHNNLTTSIGIYQLAMVDNTLNKPFYSTWLYPLYARPSNIITISSVDASTGGTVYYELMLSLVEFDL